MTAQWLSTTAHLPRRPRRAVLAAVLGLLVAAASHAQAGVAVAVARAPLETLLSDPDPVCRGEAALALAASHDTALYPRLLEVARDRERPARLRGIVAIGVLAVPGGEAFLGEVLRSTSSDDADRAAAAFALALLPPDLEAPAIHDYLRSVRGGSYRRHLPVLAAMLVGLSYVPHASEASEIAAMLEDESNKEPKLRRLALRALAPVRDSVAGEELSALLQSASADDRLGALEFLLRSDRRPDGEMEHLVRQLAEHDRRADIRTTALRVLTAARSLAALETGVAALRARDAAELAAGVRAAEHLGGGAVRAAMEQRILRADDPTLQASMMRAYDFTTTKELLDACVALAGDRHRPTALRVQAAALAARSGDDRVKPLLGDLFMVTEDPWQLEDLARAATALDPAAIPVERLLASDDPTAAAALPSRIGALVRAGHLQGPRLLSETLTSDHLGAATKASILRAVRPPRTMITDAVALDPLPEPFARIVN